MVNMKLAALALAGALVAGVAQAKDTVVSVDAGSGPWSVDANTALMPYGTGNQKPPAVIKFDIAAGKVAIIADGTTSVGRKDGIGPGGVKNKEIDDTLGANNKRYPSFYTPKVLYPVNLHALIGAFIDDKGVVVGRPFAIGDGVRVSLPDGATGLAIGFNDIDFAGNSGSLKVTVETAE